MSCDIMAGEIVKECIWNISKCVFYITFMIIKTTYKKKNVSSEWSEIAHHLIYELLSPTFVC